jgi:hypothetical protein
MLEAVAALEGCHCRLATQHADVDPREESGQCAGAAGNNISPTQHASYYSTALSIFSTPELFFFLDETQPVPWRTLTALTALGKIRPSPRALLSLRQPSQLL